MDGEQNVYMCTSENTIRNLLMVMRFFEISSITINACVSAPGAAIIFHEKSVLGADKDVL